MGPALLQISWPRPQYFWVAVPSGCLTAQPVVLAQPVVTAVCQVQTPPVVPLAGEHPRGSSSLPCRLCLGVRCCAIPMASQPHARVSQSKLGPQGATSQAGQSPVPCPSLFTSQFLGTLAAGVQQLGQQGFSMRPGRPAAHASSMSRQSSLWCFLTPGEERLLSLMSLSLFAVSPWKQQRGHREPTDSLWAGKGDRQEADPVLSSPRPSVLGPV